MLVLTAAFSFVLIKISHLWIQDQTKASMLASCGFLLFAFFGEIRQELMQHDHNQVARYRYLLSLALGIIIAVALYLKRTVKPIRSLALFLTVVSASFVLIETYNIARYHDRHDGHNYLSSDIDVGKQEVGSDYRDIYYFVLDSYTSNSSLKEFWDFDNKLFTNYLSDRYFVIAEKANSNYDVTPYSIASSLNMSYLKIPEDTDLNLAMHVLPVRELITNSVVAAELKSHGYQIVNLSPFDLSDQEKFYNWFSLPDFPYLLYIHLAKKTLPGGLTSDIFLDKRADITLRLKESLQKAILTRSSAPRFFYVHFMIPHSPFLFTSTGKTKSFFETMGQDSHKNPEGYLEQLRYANAIIMDFVDRILSSSKKTPVILIQGDHGSWLFEGDAGMRERTSIFSAYLLPGEDLTPYQEITPVNSFRIVLNRTLDTNYKLLPDRVFCVNKYYIPVLHRKIGSPIETNSDARYLSYQYDN